jgi:hypothetical protein
METEEEDRETRRARSFRERHAGTIIGAVLFGLLALVMTVQVGC